MKFLDSVNGDFEDIAQSIGKQGKNDLQGEVSERSIISELSSKEPRESYGIVRERLLEAEIEKEENRKNVEYLRKKRELEKQKLMKKLESVKEEGVK